MSTVDAKPLAPPAAAPPPSTGPSAGDDLGQKAMRGSVWTVLGYGGSQAVRFAANLMLTRLLWEEALGTMAILNSLVIGLQLFSDVGLIPSIVQNPRGDEPRFLNVAWTIQVVRGFGLWLIACALAWPMARFYDDPQMTVLVPVVAAGTVASGLCSTKLYSLRRHLSIGYLTLVELKAQAFASTVMILWAWTVPSLWALVGGTLAGQLFRTHLSHRLPGPRNRLEWDAATARELFRFGKWIFLSTVLTFAATQSDRLIFGKMIPRDLLGVYSVAFMVSMLPTEAIGRVGSSVFFPQLSKMRNRGENFRSTFLRSRVALGALGGYLVAGMLAAAQPAIDFLYDDRYRAAGWMLQVLAAGGWFRILESSTCAALLAEGRVRWMAASNAVKVVTMVVLIPLGFERLGFPGAVAALAAASFVKYLADTLAAHYLDLPVLRCDLWLTLWVVATGVGALPLAELGASHHWPAALTLLVTASTVTAGWLPVLWWQLRGWRRASGRAVPGTPA